MITEDYVSFETAKLLKEKGFDEECRAFYVKSKESGIELFPAERSHNYNDYIYPRTSAPTLQMAVKWLREVHKLGVFPTTYYREINRTVKHDYGTTIVRLDTFDIIGNEKNIEDYTFESTTYEGTVEKAIKYCLENLI